MPLAAEIAKVALLKMNVLGHASQLGVVAGLRKGPLVPVGPENPFAEFTAGQIARLLACRLPKRFFHRRPKFCRKLAAAAWRDVAPDQGGLDRNRAAAAKGIDQRSARLPETQLHQTGRQGLAERCRTPQRPVTPFV